MMEQVIGQIVDIHRRKIFPGRIDILKGKIVAIEEAEHNEKQFILPGFIDAHIHIESSMLSPAAFAKVAVKHGTVATVSDPHEIANVLGMEGVKYMIENGKTVPLKFNFGAPSCVPATTFESAGATLGPTEIRELLSLDDVRYLAEMMNYPGVLFNDTEVMEKIAIAKALKKPIDGHAPGLRGAQAKQYADTGITTDHECFSLAEAKEKLAHGMKILIREGSAAKNYEALKSLLRSHPDRVMFCSDDKHPDELLEGHINQLVGRAISDGYELFDVLHAACIAPVEHYNLPVGTLKVGDPADLIICKDLTHFRPSTTYIDGEVVFDHGKSKIQHDPPGILNNFHTSTKHVKEFSIQAEGKEVQVIKALDGQLITESFWVKANIKEGKLVADVDQDILKIAVINRYTTAPPALALIQNFGLKKGAIASCVAHDSHNIIAVGTTDEELCRAVNLVINHKGGISVVNGEEEKVLPLPIAGIMSDQSAEKVGAAYKTLDAMAKGLGSKLSAPFMTLSFMGLLVIPALKLSDKGLFDGASFQFSPLFRDPI